MSFKTKSQKSSAGQLKNLYKTEYHYNKLALQCCEDDLIKLTEKQYQKLKSYLSEGPSYFGNFHLLSDSSGTTYKHAVYTPGLGGSPIQEQNQTSSKVMELISVLKLIRFFAAKKTTDEVQSVMVTLSFQNSDKGWLSDAEQCLKVIYTKLKDWFRKTCDFGHGQWIGMMPAMEVTINEKHFKNHEEKQLYHQHLHLVLFFAGLTEHDIYSVRRQIFAKFSELCEKAGVVNSSAAYGFEKTYAKKAEKIDESSLDNKTPAETSPISAMLEATKYATKPADIEMVCEDYEDGKDGGDGGDGEGNKFAEEVFAEIYNARFNPTIHKKTRYKNIAGKKATRVRLRGAGLYEVARSTYKAIAEAGLSGVFAFNKCDGDISLIPHVFTKFATLILEKNVAKLTKKKDLTPNELLFYNKDMLKFSIMPSRNTLNRAIAKFGDTNPTPKQQAVVDVLQNFVRWNDSIDSIDEVLNEWIMTLTNDVKAATSELKAGKVESEAIEAYKERIQADEYRKSDVEHLKNAMDNAVSSTAETDSSVFDIVEKVKKTKLGKKVANYLPTDGGYQFLVRSFRNADIVVRVGNYAKKNLPKKLIDKFISDFSNGHWQYKEHDCAWMESVISYYVQLTAGKTVKKGNSLSQSDLSDIKNWAFKADTPDSRTWARYLVWLSMYYANADTERDRREAQLLGSLVVPRDVVLQMPAEHLEGSIKHLMDKTRTNNPIFKGLYSSVKTTQKAAA